jgi:hypothetical protein
MSVDQFNINQWEGGIEENRRKVRSRATFIQESYMKLAR